LATMRKKPRSLPCKVWVRSGIVMDKDIISFQIWGAHVHKSEVNLHRLWNQIVRDI
jgi:hypothetical protein